MYSAIMLDESPEWTNPRAQGEVQLVADIGATNARFQCSEGGMLVGQPVAFGTRHYSRAEDLVRDACAELACQTVDAALFALAGPATDSGQVTITNTGLAFGRDTIQKQLKCPTYLVNDFYALGHGVPYFDALHQIGGGVAKRETKCLLGPGTGLGMATIAPRKSGWWVLASEGGHADLAPGNPLEAQLWEVLSMTHAHVSWETVLSGPGLVHLYRAMCQVWGGTPEALSANEISTRGVSVEDPICHHTLESFCGLLGTAAGNLALTVAATGGVYIGGGIVGQFVDFVTASPLRRRFEERGDLTEFVSAIPIYLVVEDHPGLVGAARCLQAQLAA